MPQTDVEAARPLQTTAVRIKFAPYNYEELSKILKQTQKEFGRHGVRWYFKQVNAFNAEAQNWSEWMCDICFIDPHDAVMFSLKYQGLRG